MLSFEYVAVDEAGAMAKGHLRAASESEARERALLKGHMVVEIHQKHSQASTLARRKPWQRRGRVDVVQFIRDLAHLLDARFPLVEAIALRQQLSQSLAEQAMLEDLQQHVKDGTPLSSALSLYTDVFPSMTPAIVRAGEESGDLGGVMLTLAEDLEQQRAMRQSMRSALTYPMVLVGSTVLALVLIFVFILPRFEQMFADLGHALPPLTQFILDVGHAFNAAMPWLLLLSGLLLLAWRVLPSDHALRWQRDIWRLRLPVLSGLHSQAQAAVFAATLGRLLEKQVLLPKALNIAADALSNRVLRESVQQVVAEVRGGRTLSDALDACAYWPIELIEFTRLGEQSAGLGQSLLRLSRQLQSRVELAVKNTLALLQPMLILLVGLCVGLVVAGMMTALLSLNEMAF